MIEPTFVYIDSKPSGEPFYVGIGNAQRVAELKRNNRLHTAITRKYPGWSRTVVASMFSWESACQLERELIAQHGRRDLKTGTLANLTDGGEGTPNPSAEVRESRVIGGKKGGHSAKVTGAGIHAMSSVQRSAVGKLGGSISGKKTVIAGIGVHAMSKGELVAAGKAGFHGMTPAQHAVRCTPHKVSVNGIEYRAYPTACAALGIPFRQKDRLKLKAAGRLVIEGIEFELVTDQPEQPKEAA